MASQPAPEQELSAKSASASDVFPSNARSSVQDQDEEDEIVEQDYSNRFSRYSTLVGSGRFKRVYRGFDEFRGLDIAWSKISGAAHNLDEEQMLQMVREIACGVGLDHPNVIRTYQCWLDVDTCTINMVTEYFTSGNLREYRARHKAMGPAAVRKWVRQVVQGLAYLHSRNPTLAHGDLRADKIYVNGHSGEIKIGDLGLAVLVPKRFEPGVMPEGDPSEQYTPAVDVFALGLLTLELVTGRSMDRERGHRSWQDALATVGDAQAADFVRACLSPEPERPPVRALLDDVFLSARRAPPGGAAEEERGGEGGGGEPGVQRSRSDASGEAGAGGLRLSSASDEERAECEAGSCQGEDYLFQFSGKIRDGRLHFRLHMLYEGDPEDLRADVSSKTIDFVYDPDADTPDDIAAEISKEFALSSTDRDICAAALKEWLAKEMDLR